MDKNEFLKSLREFGELLIEAADALGVPEDSAPKAKKKASKKAAKKKPAKKAKDEAQDELDLDLDLEDEEPAPDEDEELELGDGEDEEPEDDGLDEARDELRALLTKLAKSRTNGKKVAFKILENFKAKVVDDLDEDSLKKAIKVTKKQLA